VNWILGLSFIVCAGGLTLAARQRLLHRSMEAHLRPPPKPRVESGLHQLVYLMSGRDLILTPGKKETRVLRLEGIEVGDGKDTFGHEAFDHLTPFIGEMVNVEVVRRGRGFAAGHAVLEISGINLAESLLQAGLAQPNEHAPPHYHDLLPTQVAAAE
jgi:hypothetical protein